MLDPVARFILQLVAIILASRLLAFVTTRLGQPLVIAEITAGILLGPSLLGWLAPGLGAELFPAASLPTLQLVSQLGLVLFMFLVGLELDTAQLRGHGHASVVISHSSIIAPFALGALLAVVAYPALSEPHVSYWAFTLFLGVAMSITAFPVLARILSERQLMRTPVGAMAISCAAVDDVTAWCLLAFVVAVTRAAGLGGAVLTTVFAVTYILVMFFVVRPFLARVGLRVANRAGLTQGVVAGTLLLLFASSFVTEKIGIHALFGAFLFGAILPRAGGYARVLAERLEDVVIIVLLPIFFAYSGVRTQIGLLSSWSDWAWCALIILVACLGKFGGSTLAARVMGIGWRDASTIGVLMNTRGLMELIVLNIGLDLGVIGPKLFTMMVIMALVTTFMTTPILELLRPAFATAAPRADTRASTPPSEPPEGGAARPSTPPPGAGAPSAGPPLSVRPPAALPGPPLAPLKVLACISHDLSARGLITITRALGHGSERARVVALSLVPSSGRPSQYVGAMPDDTSRAEALAGAVERARELALPLEPRTFVSADPASDIRALAERESFDLVLLGSHKPLVSQSLLGGVVARVMREGTMDIAVLVDRGLERIHRVLIPFVGTEHDRAALALARRMLRGSAQEATVLHIHSTELGGAEELGARELRDATFDDEGGRVHLKVVDHPSATDAVLEEARLGYDLVLVGLGREWDLEQRFFRIHPERLATEIPVSLLVVRHGTG
jgi:Kef-type K+ transport system membrane component KefB/nucleotide-binding universal stress UspA family protein